MKHSEGLLLSWLLDSHVKLQGRVTKLETKDELRSKETTGQIAGQWMPRDYMMAAFGTVMVAAAALEKIGWTTVLVGLAKMYGGK